MKRLILSLFMLVISATFPTFSRAYSSTTTLIVCGSCQVSNDFVGVGRTAVGARTGTFEFLVANPNTNKVFDITIESEYDQELRRYHYITEGMVDITASAGPIFAALYPYYSKSKQIHVDAPPGGAEGLNSFVGSEQGLVCNAFTGTPEFVELHHDMNEGGLWSIFANVLLQYFGHGPTGIYVFGNGDVATYDIFPDLPGTTACRYVPGTSRNALGQYINDQGMGGHGASDGNNYVRGNGQGGFTIIGTETIYSCAYLEHDDGTRELIGCTIETP